jgi:hypothetical protein
MLLWGREGLRAGSRIQPPPTQVPKRQRQQLPQLPLLTEAGIGGIETHEPFK